MDDTFDFSSFGISRRETPLSQPSSSFNSTPILAATPARAPSSNASPKTLRRSLTGSSGGLKLSDFSILGKLGEGGFGTVLLARLKSTGALCAIKLLLKQCMTTTMHAERVLREARTMMDTQHPFIVTLHGAFQDEQYVYFVLEYMGGGDLFAQMQWRVGDGQGLPEEQVRLIAAEIALALDKLHRHGYMYRDLKPENVLVSSDGHLKLADFGLAKEYLAAKKDKDDDVGASPRHSKVGTPDAIAPEIMGVGTTAKDYGFSVDWWALGILTAELLLGATPLVAGGADHQGMQELLSSYFSGEHLRDDALKRLSAPAAALIRGLLAVQVDSRLCCKHDPSVGQTAIDELKEHPFFEGLDWDALLRKELPPPLPAIESIESGSAPIMRRLDQKGKQEALQAVERNLIQFLNAPTQNEAFEGEEGFDDLELDGNPQGALCDAASKGNIELLRQLVSRGLDVNEGDYDRRTALHLAASEGLLHVVQFLVAEAEADPSPIDRWGGTPLDDAIRSSEQLGLTRGLGTNHHAAIVYLKAVGAKRGATARIREANLSADLCSAAHAGDMDELRKLVDDGADVNISNYDVRTPIHIAASEGQLEVVRYLIEELQCQISPQDRWGNTPLDDARRSGHEETAAYLYRIGATSGACYVGNSGHSMGLNTPRGGSFRQEHGGDRSKETRACVLQ